MHLVRRLRFEAQLTQQGLATLAGTSQSTIAAYEKGVKSPTLGTLEKMARSVGFELSTTFVPIMTREDRRSLCYHKAVVEKLGQDHAGTIGRAQGNLARMKEQHPHAHRLIHLWEKWLALSEQELKEKIIGASALAREMRQLTPFAGALSAHERMEVLREFRVNQPKGGEAA